MPVNRGQGQNTRWYKLCFIPTSSDSSDDSDIESVVLTPSTPTPTSSTWQEHSLPSSPLLLPPPPPDLDFLPLRPLQRAVVPTPSTTTPTSSTWQELSPPSSPLLPLPLPPSDLDFLLPWPFHRATVLTPSTPTPTSSTWQQLSPLSPPLPPLLPDFLQPRPLPRASARTFNIEVQQDRHQPPSPSHVIEGDQSDCSMNAMNGISRVRVSETDKLSQCPICMDEFKVGSEQACRLPCNHTYCSECILRWLNNSKTCPVCRLQLNGCSFDSITGNNGLDSQPEILPPPLPPPEIPPPLPPEILPAPPPPEVYNDSHWDYFQVIPGVPGIENNPGGSSDEADYDSAGDELGDPHEDSQSAPAPLT